MSLADFRVIGSRVVALFMDGKPVINNCGLSVESTGWEQRRVCQCELPQDATPAFPTVAASETQERLLGRQITSRPVSTRAHFLRVTVTAIRHRSDSSRQPRDGPQSLSDRWENHSFLANRCF